MIREGVKTERIYNDLKQDYLHSELSMTEIAKKHGISRMRLFRECKTIKEEMGLKTRPLIHKRRGGK